VSVFAAFRFRLLLSGPKWVFDLDICGCGLYCIAKRCSSFQSDFDRSGNHIPSFLEGRLHVRVFSAQACTWRVYKSLYCCYCCLSKCVLSYMLFLSMSRASKWRYRQNRFSCLLLCRVENNRGHFKKRKQPWFLWFAWLAFQF
jgi:hypothetical protein